MVLLVLMKFFSFKRVFDFCRTKIDKLIRCIRITPNLFHVFSPIKSNTQSLCFLMQLILITEAILRLCVIVLEICTKPCKWNVGYSRYVNSS